METFSMNSLLKKIKTFFKREKKTRKISKGDVRDLQIMLRDNICESLDFMDFHNGFNYHEDQNMLVLYLNMLYFDYIVDSVDPNILIDVNEEIKKEMQERINLKKEEDMNEQIIH